MRQRRLMSCYRIAAKQRVALLATLLVTAPGPEWTLYLRSCGPVHIGMTLPDVRRVLEDPRARLHNFGLDPGLALDRCAYLDSWALPPGLGLMFDRGRVVRIDVSSVAIRTASGVGVGSSEARIRAVYPGRIRAEPHQYVPDGNTCGTRPPMRLTVGLRWSSRRRRAK